MVLYDNLIPPPKRPQRSAFAKYAWILISAFMSFFFVTGVVIAAVNYHLYQRVRGIELRKPRDNLTANFTPRQPYDNLKKMQKLDDLRYYARQIGLDLEVFKIETEDGFILTLHHLYNPNELTQQRDRRQPVLMQHGLLLCLGAFLTLGRNSLAYYLVEQGYDVWMGNNRSWFEVNHANLEGNLMHNEQYWDWDIRELAYYDLPCLIDNVLAHKPHHRQVVLTGHSQGCTQLFLMLKNGLLGATHKKVKLMISLAPAIFPGPLFHQRAFIRFIHNLGRTGYKIWFGNCSFLPILTTARHQLYLTRLFGSLSYIMFKYLFGWTAAKWGQDRRLWHRHFIFNVSYVLSKLMTWWLSDWVEEGFSNQLQPKRAYTNGDHCAFTPTSTSEDAAEGLASGNVDTAADAHITDVPVHPGDDHRDSKTYFPYKQRWFGIDDRLTTVPMLIFTGKLDYLVDGDRLATHMRHYERHTYQEGRNLKIVELDDHLHLDVVWAEDVIGRIGYVIHDVIEAMDAAEAPAEAVGAPAEAVSAPAEAVSDPAEAVGAPAVAVSASVSLNEKAGTELAPVPLAAVA